MSGSAGAGGAAPGGSPGESYQAQVPGTEARARQGGYLPPGTATDVEPPEGTSVDAPLVQGTYRPDVGPGGEDIDTSDQALPNRYRTARRPPTE